MAHRQRFAVFRPQGGNWYISFHQQHWNSNNDRVELQCGTAGDVPVPGDYFGEGQIRHAVFRPSSGTWHIKGLGHNSHGQSHGNVDIQCGTAGDIPVPADYFGEGRPRIAVFRPSNGTWYIKGPGPNNWAQSQGNIEIQCGTNGDIPVPADYFGENIARVAVFRPSTGIWHIKGPGPNSYGQTSGNVEIQCGTAGDVPVAADYFGEGRPRIAVFRPSSGNWYIKGPGHAHWAQSQGNAEIQCGTNGDIPVPGHYHKNHPCSIAVFRPSNGTWYVKGPGPAHWGQSQGNLEVQCGAAGDIPVPCNFRKGNKPKQTRKFHSPQNWTWFRG